MKDVCLITECSLGRSPSHTSNHVCLFYQLIDNACTIRKKVNLIDFIVLCKFYCLSSLPISHLFAEMSAEVKTVSERGTKQPFLFSCEIDCNYKL